MWGKSLKGLWPPAFKKNVPVEKNDEASGGRRRHRTTAVPARVAMKFVRDFQGKM